LDAAAVALEASTRLLSTFVLSSADEVIEKYYAAVRACEVKLRGAMDAYRDHLVEAT
jgi:hypothetical protein